MPSVLIAPREVRPFEAAYRDVFEPAGFHIVYPPVGEANLLTTAELPAALAGCWAVVAGSERYTPTVFAACPMLKVVARVGVGYDGVDVPAASAAGVAVTIAPGTNHECAAEHAFALLLAVTRHIPARAAATRAGGWPRHLSRPVRGQTLGLVGLGRIGRAMAVRAAAFGMRVIAYDPVPAAVPGVEPVSFDELQATADVVSLHLPLTPTTRHLMNAAAFARMKPGAILLNTARGGLVDEPALVEALRSGRLFGAGLDVMDEEPPPVDHPLRTLENVVITPHAAGVDAQSLADMARSAATSIVRLWRGEWPAETVVNPEVRAAFA